MDRPWHKRAEELEPKEGHYSDYAAWREWLSAKETKLPNGGDMLALLDEDASIDSINLYCIFCDIFDSLPDLPELVNQKQTA